MANRLVTETSPYLLQHANNPVDWQPWDEAALLEARREQKPIFLSVGYAACHWCHVMEHESFQDAQIARLLNEHFICIKVDREERPDVDQIYMQAVQLLTGRGGWPMSVFLTPDREPFFAGTYWPPEPRMGMPGFRQVLEAVIDAWKHRRGEAARQAGQLADRIRQLSQPASGDGVLSEDLLDRACSALEQAFDPRFGGFGAAPKFPHPMNMQLLLRVWKRRGQDRLLEMVQVTLDRMGQGGIYDHLGGGFARYSVDQRWLVPHFEKMLYDNSLLAVAYLEAYQITGNTAYRRIVRETLDYLLRDMTDPLGGFHSSEDADSEGEEGKFYVWTPGQIHEVLGEELGERFCYVYDVTEGGNFEGSNILHLARPLETTAAAKGWDAAELEQQMADARERLLAARSERTRPGKDDKILVNWNGLAIRALARAAAALDDPVYLAAAQRAAYFLRAHLWTAGQGLWHTWRDGQVKVEGFLDDYACLIDALVDLYQADLDETWIAWAVELVQVMIRQFRDPERGDFYFTAESHQSPIARTRDVYDSSVPSATGMAATALLRLGRLIGDASMVDAGHQVLAANRGILEEAPVAAGQMLLALDQWLGPDREWIVLADLRNPLTHQWLAEVRRRWLPYLLMAVRGAGGDESRSGPLDAVFSGRSPAGDLPTVYVCQGQTCQAPVAGWQAAGQLVAGL